MSCLTIFFGPIASGKSTYARKLADQGAIIVNDDAIVTAVHGGNYKDYDVDLKPLYKSVQTAMITHGLCLGREVVVDSTGLSIDTRTRLRLLAESYDVPCNLVLFREGRFLGAPDGDRRFEADPRGYSREYWQNVGRAHLDRHTPVLEPERCWYSGVEEVPWKEKPQHVCGLSGYNPVIDPPCPACLEMGF